MSSGNEHKLRNVTFELEVGQEAQWRSKDQYVFSYNRGQTLTWKIIKRIWRVDDKQYIAS